MAHFRPLSEPDRDAVGLYYFKVLMENGDPVLLNRITEVLTRLQKQDGIAFGERLNRIVLNGLTRTPRKQKSMRW